MNMQEQIKALDDPNTTPKTLIKLLSGLFSESVMMHKNVNHEVIEAAIYNHSASCREKAAAHPLTTKEQLLVLLKSPEPCVRAAAIQNPNLKGHQLLKGLIDPSDDVKIATFNNPNVKWYHLVRGIKHWNFNVKHAALKHPNLTTKTLQKLTNLDHDTRRLVNTWYGELKHQ